MPPQDAFWNVIIYVFDERGQSAVQAVVRYAEDPDHVYVPSHSGSAIPGNVAEHVAQLGAFRCVFSITKFAEGEDLYRHLSISTDLTFAPPSWVIQYIAELFGFVGSLYDFDILGENEGALVLAQRWIKR